MSITKKLFGKIFKSDNARNVAKLDGANEFQIFLTIMLPLVKSMVVCIAIMTFMKREFNEDFNPDFKTNSFKKLLKYIENYGK